MCPPPVLTKTDFARRYAEGEFGNHSPTWDSVKEFEANPPLYRKFDEESGYGGFPLIHLRNRVAGGPTMYDLGSHLVTAGVKALAELGVKETDIYVSLMAPTERTLIQGEVIRTVKHLDLFYSHVRKPMRDALREAPLLATGCRALRLLQYYLNQRSYEWLQYLFDAYPDHVIEFSVYDSPCWGTDPGHNCVVWEVRKY